MIKESKNLEVLKPLLQGWGVENDKISEVMNVLGSDQEPEAAEPLLCQKEVCAELKISHTTLWRIDPPFYQVGRRKRYKLSEVLEHMQRQEASAAAE